MMGKKCDDAQNNLFNGIIIKYILEFCIYILYF